MSRITASETKALDTISKYLTSHNETVAIGESVTSGLIQSRFSLAKNATDFFQGGITVYNLGQKVKHLHIDPIVAEKSNSVSERVVRDMALGVSTLFNCTWGISITGYAVPVPALKIRECFALYAFSYRDTVVHEGRIDTTLKTALNSQLFFASQLIRQFSDHLVTSAG